LVFLLLFCTMRHKVFKRFATQNSTFTIWICADDLFHTLQMGQNATEVP
jgi:hypothetical protein